MSETGIDFTVGFVRANLLALLFAVPVCVIALWMFSLIHGWQALTAAVQWVYEFPLYSLGIFFTGTILHEVIHAVSWSWIGSIAWENIHFGFKWSTITPYVHCPEPLPVHSYRLGTAMPGIVLGIFPLLLALLLGSGWLLLFGLIFTIAAGGDFLILWLLRKVESQVLVRDHPDLIGCRLISSEP